MHGIPAIRREHAFAHQALDHGIDVDFVEPPTDVRSLRSVHPAQYLGALSGSHSSNPKDGPELVTIVVHLSPAIGTGSAETIDAAFCVGCSPSTLT